MQAAPPGRGRGRARGAPTPRWTRRSTCCGPRRLRSACSTATRPPSPTLAARGSPPTCATRRSRACSRRTAPRRAPVAQMIPERMLSCGRFSIKSVVGIRVLTDVCGVCGARCASDTWRVCLRACSRLCGDCDECVHCGIYYRDRIQYAAHWRATMRTRTQRHESRWPCSCAPSRRVQDHAEALSAHDSARNLRTVNGRLLAKIKGSPPRRRAARARRRGGAPDARRAAARAR